MCAKRPTTTDIAQLACVSQTTVSMILSGNPNATFSPETVKRVCSAAEQLNYRPRKKSLSGTTLPIIAVVIPTPGNPYYSTLIQSLENEASNKGYQLFICNTYYDIDTENRYLNMLSSFPFCGIVFTYLPYNRERVMSLSLTIPTVIIAEDIDLSNIDIIALNSVSAGYMVAEHLWTLGHRKIAFITTQLDKNLLRIQRLDGMKQFFSEHEGELIVKETNINMHTQTYSLNIEYNIGYEMADHICKDRSITAYVGVNDMIAYGIIDGLQDNGLNIPDDCSVCGFDNIFPSKFQNINLTTVDSFLIEKGRDAFDLLDKKIQDYGRVHLPDPCQIEYKPQLIVRKTTGKAPVV